MGVVIILNQRLNCVFELNFHLKKESILNNEKKGQIKHEDKAFLPNSIIIRQWQVENDVLSFYLTKCPSL